MVRIIFAMLMIVHGALHLLGFAREWNIASHKLSKRLLSLTTNPSKTAGIMWLLACTLFVSAGLFFILRRDWYWMPAAAGLVISQTLIFFNWRDAKYGTWINAAILIIVVFSAAAMQFNRTTQRTAAIILEQATSRDITISEEHIAALPQNVQRWIRQSGVMGKSVPNNVKLLQKGVMRTTPGGRWMPFHATQIMTIDPPAFVWTANIQAAPLVRIAGRDMFLAGHGNMLIKPLYLFTAANTSGAEVDQGTVSRYLAEMAWCPQSALSPYVTWEDLDARRTRATLQYGNVAASGIYLFDEQGRVAGFEALRYGDFGGEFRKELWSVDVRKYRPFNGVTIGSTSELTWKLPDGDFTWFKVDITSITPAE